MVKDNEAERKGLTLLSEPDGAMHIIDGQLYVDQSGTRGFPLAQLDKRTAAHLVRRIMAETGLTLLEVAAEPTQLAGDDT